jgi:hypothetical protein
MFPSFAPQAEARTLFGRLSRLRLRLRLASLLSGLGWLVAVLVGGTTIAGLLDWRLHLPPLIRAFALVAILAGAGYILLRRLLGPLWQPLDNLRLALQLESLYPRLNDSLASAVQFLEQPDDRPTDGSPVLRKVAVRQAARMAEGYDFGRLIDRRGLLASGLMAALSFALALPIVNRWPQPARIALARLLVPFGSGQWPTKTRIVVISPETSPARVALGEGLEIRAEISGVIPERATLTLWVEGTPPADQTWVIGPRKTGDTGELIAQAGRHQRNYKYRIRANDADTGWRDIQVSPPPALVPLDGRPSPQIRLDFPRYTDQKPRQLPDGAGTFEAVAGTTAYLRAATDRPVARASIAFVPEQPAPLLTAALGVLAAQSGWEAVAETAAGAAVWQSVPATLGGDRNLIEVAFTPRLSGVYALRFEDETGFGTTRLLDVKVVPDPAPQITLDRPNSSQDSLLVTPTATLPLKARIDDPMFAVRSASLEYMTKRGDAPRSIQLYDHQNVGAILPQLLPGPVPASTGGHRLRLASLDVQRPLVIREFRHPDGSPLKEGDTLTLQVVADDFDDISLGKPLGRSHEIELKIVAPNTLEAVLQQAEANIRQELLRLQQWQKDARQKVQDVAEQRVRNGQLRSEDHERLVEAEQLQQQIRGRIGSDQEGLRAEVARIRQAQRDNQLPPSASRDRMNTIAGELDRLARENLEQIEPLLTTARKEEASVKPAPSAALTEAMRQQREVETTLSELLQRLEPWSGANEIRGETRAMLQELQDLGKNTEELGKEMPAGESRDRLSPDQRQKLDAASARQKALADQSKQLLDKIDRVQAEKLDQERERLTEADRLDAAAAAKEKQATDPANKGTPRETDARREAAADRDASARQREAAAARRKEAEALKQARDAGRDGLKPDQPDTTPNQPNRLEQAAGELANNRTSQAREQQRKAAETFERMLEALEERRSDDLDRLVKKIREAERKLNDLTDRQEALQKKAREAAKIADPAKREAELARLAREQEKLRQEVRELAQELSRLRANEAGRALSRAGRDMSDAGRRLERGEPSEDVQDDALDRLDDAAKRLQEAREQIEEELLREKLAKVADRLKAMRERQAAAVAEGKRIHDAVFKAKRWDKPFLSSLNDLADTERGLALEVEGLVEKRFQGMKVVARMLERSAEAMANASKKLEDRRDEIKNRVDEEFIIDDETIARDEVLRLQETALRRLDQLLEAVKFDRAMARQGGGGSSGGGGGGGEGGGGAPPGGPPSDGLPPLAQIKALRALQQEAFDRTEKFAKANPDLTRLSDIAKAELDDIGKLQRDVRELIEELTPAEAPEGGKR